MYIYIFVHHMIKLLRYIVDGKNVRKRESRVNKMSNKVSFVEINDC